MWIVGFLGMALKTVEITLAMLYRNTDDPDDPHGGAMWVIDKTLGARGGAARILAKVIGFAFALACLVMTMAGGNMFQTWNVANLTFGYFGIPPVATGILLAILVGLVIIGGIKRIGRVAGRLVPLMCALYLLSALAVLAVNVGRIPELLLLIVTSAFRGADAAGAFVGGAFGVVFAQGMQRALFSNEAGLGSAPIAHAAAKTGEPAREGVVGGLGPFIDTLCICTLTALVILCTGTWNRPADGAFEGDLAVRLTEDGDWALEGPEGLEALPDLGRGAAWQTGWSFFVLTREAESGQWMRAYGEVGGSDRIRWVKLQPALEVGEGDPPGRRRDLEEHGAFRAYAGAALTGHAFDRAFPGLGKWLVTLACWLFAVSTMISWSYYGEQSVIYMFGKPLVLPYKVVFLILAVVGCVIVRTDAELGALADFGTGGMLLANMVIVLSCGFLAVRALRDYFTRLDRGDFHPHRPPPREDLVSGRDVEP
jgi:AGCS family alanine or glycine:cation symporter